MHLEILKIRFIIFFIDFNLIWFKKFSTFYFVVFFTILCKNLIEEVAYCKVPDAEMAGVFPPVLLQWEIIHADGSSEKIPESPKETMALPLDIVVSEAYSGSRLIW
jgi:hypothetical protein